MTAVSGKIARTLRKEGAYHIYILPAVILTFLFKYVPLVGIVMAFQKFTVFKGWFNAKWIGLDNFTYVITMPGFSNALANTIIISVLKIVTGLFVPIGLSLMLNELRFKKMVQTITYLPYFMSWIILGGIILEIFSSDGLINQLLRQMGLPTVYFLSDNRYFRSLLVITDLWKNAGFNMVVYIAALTAIDPTLYEAAMIDGAGRWKQTLHVTLPGIRPTIVLLATLSLGNVLNAGFDQVFVLLNTLVMDTGDILDTFVYRLAFNQAQYSVATAVGLFKSVIGFALISLSYYLAAKYADYRIF